MRKLYGLFTSKDNLKNTIRLLKQYSDKVFVLELRDSEELLCTCNSHTHIPNNPLILHKKGDSNTLYSLNGLNALIQKENNGQLDSTYKIDWSKYRSSIILTQGYNVRITSTKIYKII